MSVIKSTDADFKELINKNEKVVVKYYADWCGSCRLFSPKYNRLANDEKFAGIIFLDVNAEQNPEARKIAAKRKRKSSLKRISSRIGRTKAKSKRVER
jgi:thiol-disulfide isomerase/thioredoxin